MLLLRYYDVGNWLFFLFPIHFFLFVKVAKKLKTERNKTGIPLYSIFIFGIFDYFVVRHVFLNQLK